MAGGYRSHEAKWIGGISGFPPIGGYRSFEAFWLGGASSPFNFIPPQPVPVVVNAGARALPRVRKKITEDDDILLVILSQHMSRIFGKKSKD